MSMVPTQSNIPNLQKSITSKPYSISTRINLAKAYQVHGYPDLAVGEAYIALLLVDECLGESGEFEDEAVEAALEDFGRDVDEDKDEDGKCEKVIEVVGGKVRVGIYILLIKNLIACGNLKQANDYLKKVLDTKNTPEDVALYLEQRIQDTLPGSEKPSSEYPEWGLVRREVYPWNEYEPDRSTQESLTELNKQLTVAAPKLEARIVELPDLTTGDETSGGVVKQIGLFAKEDLQPGEQILREKSILTGTARINDSFCDACAAKLPNNPLGSTNTGEEGPVSCPDCAETVFCSEDCLNLATSLYHPALCDAPLGSLAKDAPAKEASHALYALLLLRTLALATHQETHPLSLPQTCYLWGDFLPRPDPALPFNLHYNVILPFTMLEKMDVNAFTESTRFNTWTFNTLYAKFRGTADAKQGLDGRPEVGAVHPLWCLANHSCAPNVRWEWEGSMGFWVRTEAQSVKWRDGEGEGRRLKKDEQVIGHYCDVELPVKERREWARGALGGDCKCERCVWESGHPGEVRMIRIAR